MGGCAGGGSDAENVGNTQESDAGGEEHENVFVALCNSEVFNVQMDSATIQRNIDSLYETTINGPDPPPNLADILNLAPPTDEQLPSSSLQDPVTPLPSQSRIIPSALNPVRTRHEGDIFPVTTPHDKKMEHVFISTNHFLTSGNVILGENIEYNSTHSLSGATSTPHDHSSLSSPERPDSDLPPNPSNLEEPALWSHNLDTMSALEPSSRAHSPPVDASVPVSRLLMQLSTPAPVRIHSQEYSRGRKLMEKGQPFEQRAEVYSSLLLHLLHVYITSHVSPSPPVVRQLFLPPSRPVSTIGACTAPIVVSPAIAAGVCITFGVGRIMTHVESEWRLRCGGKGHLVRVRATAARRGGVESRSLAGSRGRDAREESDAGAMETTIRFHSRYYAAVAYSTTVSHERILRSWQPHWMLTFCPKDVVG